jgi:1-deoxyxylulose-5-phosphate synthase
MQYTKLGNSDLTVSQICLGCMGFGDPTTGIHNWTLNESESSKIIGHALEQGINFFDTAIAYQNGSSER